MCCVKATILEEMPPFPERESSILAKLKKKRPDKVANNTIEPRAGTDANDNNAATQPTAAVSEREIVVLLGCTGTRCSLLLQMFRGLSVCRSRL